MSDDFGTNCPKCGKKMYYHMLLKTTRKGWECHWGDDELICNYEECYEVSFYCYNKECQPEEDEV